MIVELIGCAGAGKTTLSRMLRERGLPGRRVLTMSDLVVDRPLLREVRHPTLVNVAQELASLPFLLTAGRRERSFVRFAGTLLAQAPSTYDKLNGMRGIARKVGMYRLAASRARDKVVLSDEGTLLSSYNLFVQTGVPFAAPEVERFLAVVPLPDRVVYVRAPVAALVARARTRPDPRKQHIGRDADDVERDIRETVRLFDLVAASPALRDRVLVLRNEDGDTTVRERLVDELAASLAPSPPAAEPRLGAPIVRVEPGGL